MAKYLVKYNFCSRSPNVEAANRLAKTIDKKPETIDGHYYIIKGSELTSETIELVSLVSGWKGTEFYINDKMVNDLENIDLIINCDRKHFCTGDCFFLNKWSRIFTLLKNPNVEMDEIVTEKTFNVDAHPDIVLDSNSEYFSVKTMYLKDDFEEFCQMSLDFCPKFDKYKYYGIFKSIPESIKIRRIDYNYIQKNKEALQEKEINDSLNEMIRRIGDELETRLRRVLKEYFKE
jgi:hypothetical protein